MTRNLKIGHCKKIVSRISQESQARLEKLFNTAHYIAKENLAFQKYASLCERSFSAMNRIKTSLKTTMQQGTLQDLMTVSSSSEDIKYFDPKPAISNWFLGSKRKRHFVSASCSGHLSIAKGKNDSAYSSGATEIVVEGEEEEEEEILPPLPELPE